MLLKAWIFIKIWSPQFLRFEVVYIRQRLWLLVSHWESCTAQQSKMRYFLREHLLRAALVKQIQVFRWVQAENRFECLVIIKSSLSWRHLYWKYIAVGIFQSICVIWKKTQKKNKTPKRYVLVLIIWYYRPEQVAVTFNLCKLNILCALRKLVFI